MAAEKKDGKLALSQMRRIRQLGSGDGGLGRSCGAAGWRPQVLHPFLVDAMPFLQQSQGLACAGCRHELNEALFWRAALMYGGLDLQVIASWAPSPHTAKASQQCNIPTTPHHSHTFSSSTRTYTATDSKALFSLPLTHCFACCVAFCKRRFAMKTLEKSEMLERNKVQRVLAEAAILNAIDHPFLASLWGTIVTKTHLHFLMEVRRYSIFRFALFSWVLGFFGVRTRLLSVGDCWTGCVQSC